MAADGGFMAGLAAELAEAVRQVVREELAAAGVAARPVEKEWMTLNEVAEFLGYSPEYVRRRKDIPRHSTGERGAGRLRYRRTEIEDWMAKQPGRRA